MLREICALHETPEDVTYYMARHFYFPLCNAWKEKMAIDRLAAQCQKASNGMIQFTGNIDEVHRLLRNPLMRVLDRRIVNDRLNKYIFVLQRCCEATFFDIRLAFPVFVKGLEVDHVGAFRTLQQYGALSLCQDLDNVVDRMTRKISSKATWDKSVSDNMLPLVRYYLDKNMNEPILEWLTVWFIKGFNCVRDVESLLSPIHKDKLELLKERAAAPEMKRKRLNVLKYGLYANEVMEDSPDKRLRYV